MSLFDPVYLTAGGEPVPGRVPVRLVIEDGGAPTARQMAELEAVYADFCTEKRLSIVQYHDVERTLSDGSRVRLNSIYGVDTVYARIEPSGDLEPVPWVAYTAYTDLEWLDIYSRIVLGGTGGGVSPPGDPEPEFTIPPPDRDGFQRGGPPASMDISISWSGGGNASFNIITNFGSSVSGSIVREELDGSNGHTSKTTYTNVPRLYPGPDSPDHVVTDGVDWVREGGATWIARGVFPGWAANNYLTWSVLRSYWHWDGVGSGPDQDFEFNTLPADAAEMYEDARGAAEAAGNAAFAAAEDIWRDQWRSWRDSEWIPWRDRIINSYVTTPSDKPLVNLRRAGRALQLESLRQSLDAGVNMPHLAARYLACPFNIITKPDGTLPAGPDNAVSASNPTGAPHRSVTYTLNGAVRESEWVDNIVEPWDVAPYSRDIAPFDQDAPHLLGRDFANPKNLFGWLATGSVQRLARYRPYHAAERAYVDPRSLGGVSFNDRGGYKALMDKGVVASTETTLRVSTDGYIPARTKVTMVQLEYEVFDPYTEQWIWTPHVRITQYDAIWIQEPGEYLVGPLPDTNSEGTSPRRIRFRSAFEQTRNADMSWSSPKPVPLKLVDGKRWEQDMPLSMAYMPPAQAYMQHHPTGIAILERLSPAAKPRVGTSRFYFGAQAIWPDLSYLNEVLTANWDEAPGEQTLCAAALRAVGKLETETP